MRSASGMGIWNTCWLAAPAAPLTDTSAATTRTGLRVLAVTAAPCTLSARLDAHSGCTSVAPSVGHVRHSDTSARWGVAAQHGQRPPCMEANNALRPLAGGLSPPPLKQTGPRGRKGRPPLAAAAPQPAHAPSSGGTVRATPCVGTRSRKLPSAPMASSH